MNKDLVKNINDIMEYLGIDKNSLEIEKVDKEVIMLMDDERNRYIFRRNEDAIKHTWSECCIPSIKLNRPDDYAIGSKHAEIALKMYKHVCVSSLHSAGAEITIPIGKCIFAGHNRLYDDDIYVVFNPNYKNVKDALLTMRLTTNGRELYARDSYGDGIFEAQSAYLKCKNDLYHMMKTAEFVIETIYEDADKTFLASINNEEE